MLVRLKRRGKLPPHPTQSPSPYKQSEWRGAIIEVEPHPYPHHCGTDSFRVIDTRLGAGKYFVCSHYLVDDLDAYDSDFCDEQAQEGDLALAPITQRVEVKRG